MCAYCLILWAGAQEEMNNLLEAVKNTAHLPCSLYEVTPCFVLLILPCWPCYYLCLLVC